MQSKTPDPIWIKMGQMMDLKIIQEDRVEIIVDPNIASVQGHGAKDYFLIELLHQHA